MAKKKKSNRGKTDEGMKKRLANLKKGKKFQKGNNANPKGRPRIMLSEFNAELIKQGIEPVTPSQIDTSYRLFFNLTTEEIKAIALDEKKGILLRQTAKSLLSPAGQRMLEDMMNRSMGMAKQITEGNINLVQHKLPDMSEWSQKQTEEFIQKLEQSKIYTGTSSEASPD